METEDELIKKIKKDPFYIQYIENPSEKVQLAAVRLYASSIYHIKNPSERVQLEAINENPYNIMNIKNPSEEIQLKAVQQHGRSITFIENPTEKVIQAAILNGAEKEDLEHIDISKLSDETKLMIELL